MQPRKKNRFDSTGIGMLIGLILPLLIFFTVFLFGDKDLTFSNYVKNLWYMHALVKLGSLCIFANSAAFMLFIKLKHDKTSRGILGATLLYAFVVLISRAL